MSIINWEPIYTERQEVSQLKSVILGIAKDLQAELTKSHNDDPSLISGTSGLVLFYAYLEKTLHTNRFQETFDSYLLHTYDALGNNRMPGSLFYGFAGITWLFKHLVHIGSVPKDIFPDDLLPSLNQYLWKAVEKYKKEGNRDLLEGLIGLGVCALEEEMNVAIVAEIIAYLEHTAQWKNEQIHWLNIKVIPIGDKQTTSYQEYNLGLAHGIPSIIAFLSKAHRRDIMPRETLKLINGTVSWLLSQEVNLPTHSFPHTIISGKEPETDTGNRLAWCFGDLGIAVSLIQAGIATQNQAWQEKGIAIAMKVANRKMDSSGVIDPVFCHGSIGVAHMFNKIYQTTKMPEFKSAVKYWVNQTLELRKSEFTSSGFYCCFYNQDKKVEAFAATGLLGGSSGVGLVLMSLLSSQQPEWDKVFLL